MAVYRRLCQPLWSWSCKYQRRIFCLNLHNETLKPDGENINEELKLYKHSLSHNRKAISLKKLITTCPELYNKIMKEDLSNIDWQNIRDSIIQNSPATDKTVDCTIIDLCLNEFYVDKAMKYFQFLKEHDYPLNLAIIGKYLRLFVLKRVPLTDAEKREIVTICDSLMEKYPCLDAITAEHCIVSLCLTDQWEKSNEIINMIKVTTTPGLSVYSALAAAAFQHDKPDIGWNALHQIVLRGLTPQDNVYWSYLQYCKQADRKFFDERLENMFAFWADNWEKPYSRVLNAYAEVASRHGWSAAPTNILEKGQCRKCSNQLSDLTFSQDTFQDLANDFMKRVIVGSDIYYKSHPQELRKFTEFVARTKPYDVVIDGLNVTYMTRDGIPRPEYLVKVVQHFVKRKQTVLVLTRRHQKNLSVLNYIQRNAFVFWTDNLSSDDPYLLYATLASGEKAMFVSSDLMRQHKHLLQDRRLQLVFKKWQCSHQYFAKAKGKQVQVMSPFNFIPHAQKNSDSWHVPCVSDNSTNPETYEFPEKWYCFHKKDSKSK